MERDVLCLKIGGSVITDKQIAYKVNLTNIKRLAKVLKKVKQPLLIAHGSGSFGHTSAKLYGGIKGYNSRIGITKVSRDAMAINNFVIDELINEGLPVISFRPQSFIVSKEGKLYSSFFDPILLALKQGLIPIIYGDVIWDIKWKSTIFSGERILYEICRYLISKQFSINSIVQLTDVDGVLSNNGKVIKQITKDNWNEVKKSIYPLSVNDVTGGMEHKINEALIMAQCNVPTYIINGTNESFEHFLDNKTNQGTFIH